MGGQIEPVDWEGSALDSMIKARGAFVAYGEEVLLIHGSDAFLVAVVTAPAASANVRLEIAEAIAARLSAE
ncbi:MAG: hypothetical protein ACXW3D_08950 [Caulobacteraceae bacterium]